MTVSTTQTNKTKTTMSSRSRISTSSGSSTRATIRRLHPHSSSRQQRRRRRRHDVIPLIVFFGLACMMYVIELDHLHNRHSPPSSVVTAPNKANPSTLKLDYTPEKVASVPRKRMRGFNRQSVDMVRKEIDEFSIWVQQAVDTMAGDDEDKRQRILAILKTKWPECLEQNLTSLECKELIDYEIKNTTLFTGAQDKAISTVILRTRNMEDENFNWIVIRTNSNSGRTIGVWGDGWVYYDFPWNSTGIEADRATLINDIPPWNGNPVVNGSTIDEFRGVINNHETITAGGRRRLSVSIDRTKIIAGGTYTLNYTDTSGPPDSPTAAAQLDAFLSSSKVIGAAGVRNLGPWNCKGLSGVSCCAKIKHSVRDKDVHGKAVQCWIEPFTATLLTKKLCEEDLTKVCIYERHDGKVWKDPILSFDKVLDEAIDNGRDITKSDGKHE